MQKLINAVQNYAWGSHTALTELYGIANPDNLPMAELWMGAHPKSSSQILAADGQPRSLREVIDADKAALLGDKVAARFGELPFLFKVLCAAQPLSIQVHPNKQASEEGFARENAAGIPLSAAERNYKDPNHKPELVFALTPFLAMNAFREFSEIVSLLQPVAGANKAIAHFLENPNADALSQLFASMLNMQGEEKSHALAVLKAALNTQQGEPWETIRLISEFYPDDSGLFSPLLLNVVKLNPGEAMFLFAETPHAYLHGCNVELMANSDNVLRGGLTSKHVDVNELLAVVDVVPVTPLPVAQQALTPGVTRYQLPTDEFHLLRLSCHGGGTLPVLPAVGIALNIGEACVVQLAKRDYPLQPGESVLLPAGQSVVVSGESVDLFVAW